MIIDPINEVKYRFRLAERYLEEAKRAYRRGDYREAVSCSQLAAENSAKSIVALFRVPSWSHDPSDELLSLVGELPESVSRMAAEIAGIARSLASEHGRAVYGEPSRGLTPWEIYRKEDAKKALEQAKRAFENSSRILSELKAV